MNRLVPIVLVATSWIGLSCAGSESEDVEFFERKIRPILANQCYQCHSEKARTTKGGLLLDRRAGWLKGGNSGKAIVPGEPDASLLIQAISHSGTIKMPPKKHLESAEIKLLVEWVRRGAPGPREDLGQTKLSQLGDQTFLFNEAQHHWAFQPIRPTRPPIAANPTWNHNPIDRFIFAELTRKGLSPATPADPRTLMRRMSFDLTGLPPTLEAVRAFAKMAEDQQSNSMSKVVDELIHSPSFGEHVARMWLDVARYADTDSFYRPDTRTPHYLPFAFTYRDYVIASFNRDKPFDQFVREQLAADLMDFAPGSPELAATGFLTVGPHVNRNQTESIDDWIDVTTRGLMGMTAACARCHDHKYEPIPTTDYYALHGIFSSVTRIHPLDQKNQPLVHGYDPSSKDRKDFEQQLAAITKKITGAGKKTSKNNNRSVAQKIRETELAKLLLFHPGAPAHTMVVREKRTPTKPVVFLRGDPRNRGPSVARRFLSILDKSGEPFPESASGRMELANKIVDPSNPLTARVFVNRVWGLLMGSYLVETASDFGIQGTEPSHPLLLDWLAHDFISHDWSVKHLVRQIVDSAVYRQSSAHRADMAAIDPSNRLLWRAHRKHLRIESVRDSLLAVSGQLDSRLGGRASQLWGGTHTNRRTIYGYINRFNLDPTLRAFDFPTPMQTQANRGESIVAPQALFTMNSPFVVEAAAAMTHWDDFLEAGSNQQRINILFARIFQRSATHREVVRLQRFLSQQDKLPQRKNAPEKWAILAQALIMSNEFQYID